MKRGGAVIVIQKKQRRFLRSSSLAIIIEKLHIIQEAKVKNNIFSKQRMHAEKDGISKNRFRVIFEGDSLRKVNAAPIQETNPFYNQKLSLKNVACRKKRGFTKIEKRTSIRIFFFSFSKKFLKTKSMRVDVTMRQMIFFF